MSDNLFSTFNSKYFSQIIFLNLFFTYFAIDNDLFHHNDTLKKKIDLSDI